MADTTVDVVLKLSDQLSDNLAKAESKVAGFRNVVDRLAGAFAPVSIAAAAGLGISIKLAADFDAAIQGAVRGLDLSGQAITDFSDSVRAMQKELNYQFSSTELANIATSAGKLGVAVPDIDDFTKSVAKIAIATDQADKIDELATNASKVATVFKLSVAETDKFLNAVNALDDVSSATSNNLLDFSKRVSGVAATSRLSAVNVAAYGATLISAGQTSNVAATFMEKFLAVLGAGSNLSDDAKDKLKLLGYSAEDLGRKFDKNANGTMLEFLNRVKAVDSISQREILGKVFGQEHVSTALLLTNQTAELAKFLDQANNSAFNAAKAQNEFNKASQSFGGMSKQFKFQLQEIGVQLGLAILPGLLSVMSAITPLLQKFVEFTQLNPAISTVIVTLLGIAATVTPILMLISSISGVIAVLPVIQAGILSVGAAIGAATIPISPFILGCVAIGAIGGYIVANWSSVKPFFQDLWLGIRYTIQQFIDWIKSDPIDIVNTVVGWIIPLPGVVGLMGSNAGKSLISGFVNGIQSMYSYVSSAMSSFSGWINQYLPHSDAKKGELSQLTNSGKSFTTTFFDGVKAGGVDDLGGMLTLPSITPPASSNQTSPTSSSSVILSPTYNITATSNDDLIKQLKARDKQFLQMINDINSKNNRNVYA